MRSLLLVFASLALCLSPPPAAAQIAAAVEYAPHYAPCPRGTKLVREVGTRKQTLSAPEAAYVATRQSTVLPAAWRSYLRSVERSTPGAAALPAYVSEILSGDLGIDVLPTLGIATSGGSYRAAIFGAGVLNQLDGRNASSVRSGMGGLLQAASYLAGLSGGGWLVSSLVQADFPSISDLVFGSETYDGYGGWLTQFGLLAPSTDLAVDAAYIVELVQEVAGKALAGYPVTIADVWARALSRHFVNGTNAGNFADNAVSHGAGITMSSIAQTSSFAHHKIPFPILLSDSMSQHGNSSNIIPGNFVPISNPIYEFNVFETGSFDPMLGAFTPTEFLGSWNDSICTTGFDQLSFIQSCSSMIFNANNITSTSIQNSSIGPILEILEDLIPESGIELDTAAVPNPFFGLSPETYIDSTEQYLSLVDGGEDGQVIPLQPLLVQARNVEVILAIDATSDIDNFAAGTSMIAAQARAALFPHSYAFPAVPTSNATFRAHNLTTQPTFFGCDAPPASRAPLIVYLANGAPPRGQAPLTNTSTAQLAYAPAEVAAMLAQVADVAVQGRPVRGAADPEWPACLACAVVDRARRRVGRVRDGLCERCLERYCWS
ncbi:lysophospholipase [Amylocystis lapponica]|nr:lysophospholipase [Amylocystis lapponica]